MLMKTRVTYCHKLIRIAKIEDWQHQLVARMSSNWKELSHIAGISIKSYNYFGKLLDFSLYIQIYIYNLTQHFYFQLFPRRNVHPHT
jgi:hypothetical protein